MSTTNETIHHPAHYGGADDLYEVIKVIEAWGLGFCLGNVVKYIGRAGKKSAATATEDLKKARWYLDREIAAREASEILLTGAQQSTMDTALRQSVRNIDTGVIGI